MNMSPKEEVQQTRSFREKIIILLLVMAVIAFYWFQVRPSQIRAECGKITDEKVGRGLGAPRAEVVNTYYELCLHTNGL